MHVVSELEWLSLYGYVNVFIFSTRGSILSIAIKCLKYWTLFFFFKYILYMQNSNVIC